MTTWAGIVRVSDLGGRGGDSFHADQEQVEAVERYARARGASVEFMPPELSVSGGKPINQRPSLRTAIEGVEAGRFDGIVVAYLSRLTRSRSGLQIWERVEAAGGHVHCAQEDLDTSTPNGRYIRDIHLANAVREREEHVDRFANRRREATAAGVWQARQTPTGYRRDERSRGLVPDDRADAVRKAFRDRAAGVPLVEIAATLGMTPSGVRQLLRNDVYLGILRVGEHVNQAAHEPLVDRTTFEAAQVKIARPPRSMPESALLAGLVRCAGCGHVMSRKRTANVVYACAGLHSGARCPAPASVTTAKLDTHVEAIALAELERLSVTMSGGHGVESARRALADAEYELAAFLEHASARDPGFGVAVQKRRDAVEAARERLGVEQRSAGVVTTASSGAEMWEFLQVHERNTVLRGLLEAVVVARAGGRGARVALDDRVRVVAFGTGLDLPERRGHAAAGIRPLVVDRDAAGVLRVPGGEHGA